MRTSPALHRPAIDLLQAAAQVLLKLVRESLALEEPLIWVSEGLGGGGIGERGVGGLRAEVGWVVRGRLKGVLRQLREGRRMQDLRLQSSRQQ